jgi:TP901 family phage tail tape measure protein
MANQNTVLEVFLKGDSTQLVAALNKAQSRVSKFSAKLKTVGSNLSRNVTLPLALVGGAAVKMAMSFDESMTKIQALVGLSAEEVDKMREGVIQLAKDTGQSAGDAADALFFITSAGLEGAEAMEVLEASLKASTAGLGDVATIADAATSAMNAYGSDSLSASQATDVLVAAVREGKLESTELAGAIGQVIPIASNMGVTFDEVGAVLAGMSRTGTNAATASMQLKNILTSILKPSKEGADALEDMNLSSEKLRQIIQEDGLLAVLQRLKTEFQNNGDAQQKVFGNTRALMGIMDLLGKGADQTAEIFNELANASGATAEAFQKTAGSPSFQLKDAISDVKNSLTEIGEEISVVIVPMIKSLSKFIVFLSDKFKGLSPTMKTVIVSLVSLAALAGPLLYLAGTVLPAVAVGVKGVTLALQLLYANPVIAGIGVLIAAITFLGQTIDNVVSEGKVGTLKTIGNLFKSMGNQALFRVLQAVDHAKAVANENKEYKSFEETLAGVNKELDSVLSKNLNPSDGDDGGKTTRGIVEQVNAISLLSQGYAKMGDAAMEAGTILSNVPTKVENGTKSFVKSFDVIKPFINAFADSVTAAFDKSDGSFKSFAASMLQILGDLIIQMGLAAIAASEISKTFAIPIVGAVAGAAAVAIGGVIRGIANKMRSGGVQEFAKGGIISGPTLGLMGEYPGARSNPEVVAPLNRLKSMLGDGTSNKMTGEFVLRGQDLVVALQRAERNRNRII